MNTPTQNDVLANYKNAPKEVREVLASTKLAELISDIVTRNSLSLEIMRKIAEYNRNLLLGFISVQDFLKGLIEEGVSSEVSEKIVAELNQKIFGPTLQNVRENRAFLTNEKKSILKGTSGVSKKDSLQKKPSEENNPIIKKYAVDPYHEPIDE